jgi:hypothetical protein
MFFRLPILSQIKALKSSRRCIENSPRTSVRIFGHEAKDLYHEKKAGILVNTTAYLKIPHPYTSVDLLTSVSDANS